MRFIIPRNSNSISLLLDSIGSLEPTYDEQGATLSGERPIGYRYLHEGKVIGRGPKDFLKACQGLRQWRTHSLPGLRVFPHNAPLKIGESVLVALGTDFAAIGAPCRIIQVIEKPAKFGFVYGTLPGHPEKGEEAFIVSIDEEEKVRFEVSAFSKASDLFTRTAGPLGRCFQLMATKGYIHAMNRYMLRIEST